MSIVLHMVRLGLWRLPFQRLWQRIHNSTQPRWVSAVLVSPPTLSDMIWALDAASWYTPKQARCLSRAFTLYLLMRWFGYAPTLQIGVAKPEASDTSPQPQKRASSPQIEAHAWIEYEGEVIVGQVTNLARFVPLPSIVSNGEVSPSSD